MTTGGYGTGGYNYGQGCYSGPIYTSGGVGVNHYYSGGYANGGVGIIPATYVTNYYSNNHVWISSNWNTVCNSYYGYGYWDWYTNFGGYPFSGYCYNGWYGDLSFTLVYPFLDAGCELVTFIPRNDRRIVILRSICGTFWWRITERRTWIPGGYTWIDGYYQWVPGYYTWRVTRQQRIYDYWDFPERYH